MSVNVWCWKPAVLSRKVVTPWAGWVVYVIWAERCFTWSQKETMWSWNVSLGGAEAWTGQNSKGLSGFLIISTNTGYTASLRQKAADVSSWLLFSFSTTWTVLRKLVWSIQVLRSSELVSLHHISWFYCLWIRFCHLVFTFFPVLITGWPWLYAPPP